MNPKLEKHLKVLSGLYAEEATMDDYKTLVATLKSLGATIVYSQGDNAMKKRVTVFGAPKRNTGDFPFSFFKLVPDADGRKQVVLSDAVIESFKKMGYKQGKPLRKGSFGFTKGAYRFVAGASVAHAGMDNGHMQGLIVSFEKIE